MSVYDAIHKRHKKFVMNQQISCSVYKQVNLTLPISVHYCNKITIMYAFDYNRTVHM